MTGNDSYPLSEHDAETVQARSGRPLSEINLDALSRGELGLTDISISSETLRRQADIARRNRRETLALAFERAAELVDVPHELLLRCYEILRPGRAGSSEEIHALARQLRDRYGAERIAEFMEEAAEAYVRRGMFVFRY